ncbi:hypothetical protein VTN00DRAFT_7957 [Thermoascus crustaceus]|uniref:uncharacterized protein n=1 Tax=Thermoascus crustaceus TaxID=5088 RepID=UPI0037438A1C
MPREFDPLIDEFQHDKSKPREAEALLMLRKVASLVKPIMRQRCWRVGALCEFYPQERNLLGLNMDGGRKILLRLRQPYDERQFLSFEAITDTMLHELCHIVHGPHNQQFHALWDQLRRELEELIAKGYTGEGFLSNGRRLGGQRIPLHEARRRARAAAERRRTLTAGSGQRLGGTPILRGTDMRAVIANAAQRRIEVMKGCASGTDAGRQLAEEASRNGFRTKAEEDDANERAIMEAYIEMIQEEERERYGSSYVPPSQDNPAGPQTSRSPPPVPESTKPKPPSQSLQAFSEGDLVYSTSDNESYDHPWTCPICTLENPANFLCCDACASERPQPSKSKSASENRVQASGLPASRSASRKPTRPSTGSNTLKFRTSSVEMLEALDRSRQKRPLGWVCHKCGAFMETEWWTCSSCGTMKQSS